MTADSQYVAKIFNEMADEYDNLKDPWYSYSFGEIDKVLRKHFYLGPAHLSKPVALDIGCGTGIQSLTLGEMGYCVEGIDIADHLIDVAKAKAERAGLTDIRFQRADAINLPFENNYADIVNCCGPTLSFIAEWRKALQEMARCTKPGGRLLLEVEGETGTDDSIREPLRPKRRRADAFLILDTLDVTVGSGGLAYSFAQCRYV